MANCVYCGKPAGVFSNVHPACQKTAHEAGLKQAGSAEASAPAAAAPSDRAARAGAPAPGTSGRAILCNVFGFVFLLTGLYFLVLAPGLPTADALPDSVAGIRVVNFQRLAMGQAFTVAGAIFLAAAWRPR